ncbi:MAG: NAD-dependent DNA ligase LigA [Opitutus sp.]|nr:NAD-dependent DNA ligase LigA [Opitutus sp.]
MKSTVSDSRRGGFYPALKSILASAGLVAATVAVWWFVLTSTAGLAAENAADARREIAGLRHDLARHDAAYHQQAAPEIPDSDYDQLKQRLAALERQFPDAAKAVPPLPEIGDDRTGLLQTHRHRERMLSLEKTYAETELRALHARLVKRLGRDDLAYVVEPKFDGLAVSVTYEKGKLVRAITRGNGTEGDDVTAHVRQIAGLPRELHTSSPPALIEVRGEIFVPFDAFARVNAGREAAGETRFANPRNLAAGTLRQLDGQEVVRRGLRIVFFGVGACEPVGALPATQRELPAHFKAWGLPGIDEREMWPAQGADEMVRAVDACRRARPDFGFPTDGAVVKLDSLAGQREAGAGETAPRWAVAFKFPPDRAETQVLAITVQVGRTGVLTPVAELAPVVLSGSTIGRASLHNRDEIARKDIRIGDTVVIEKAGEIIPAIVGVNLARRPATARTFVFPDACPECRAALPERKGEVTMRCVNGACPAQLRRRIEHFASKGAVDIAGLGPAMVDALVQKGMIADLPDIYRLRREDVLSLGQNVTKSADQLFAAIEASKRAELWRFVYGLGIPQVGAVAARDLARRFRSLEALAAAAVEPGARSGHRAGEVSVDPMVRAVAVFFADEKNRAVVAKLIAAGVQPAVPPAPVVKSAVTGKIFVLTGALPTLTRAQAAGKIEAAGGRVGSGVSRATHFVVAGAEAGAKLDQARALGLTILDEAALLRLLGGE